MCDVALEQEELFLCDTALDEEACVRGTVDEGCPPEMLTVGGCACRVMNAAVFSRDDL